MALCTVCFLAWEADGRIDRIKLDDYDVIVKAHRFGANLLSTCYQINKWNKSANERTPPPSGSGEHDQATLDWLACEQVALALARKARLPCCLSSPTPPPPPPYSRESLLARCRPSEMSIGYLDVLSRPVPVLVKFWLENYITGKLRYIKPRRIKLKKRKGGDKISK